ncbi:MAG TPA: phage holin family protein [Sphingobacterium sp.]|nr:phage holin family protein [Sphingobacterium sp.]
MLYFIINLIITGLVVTISAWIIPGVEVASFFWAMVTGLVIGAVNSIVGGILRFFTFPLNILTLGLVSFIITVLMVMLASSIMGDKFNVSSFWTAMIFAIVVAIIEMLFSRITNR